MFVRGFPAQAFDTNCWVVAPAAGEQCVVIDPGIGVQEQLDALLREHKLQPVAVLLTHGHLDHTFSVTPVCGARDVPAYIHPADRAMIADPGLGVSPQLVAMLGDLVFREPADVREIGDGDVLDLGGVLLTVDHTPGHTQGSVVFRTTAETEQGATGVVLAGDTLFAGSVGRTDLPGGSHEQMLVSIRDKLLLLEDSTVVLPGHGPGTTIGRERAGNPFLAGLAPPRRGL